MDGRDVHQSLCQQPVPQGCHQQGFHRDLLACLAAGKPWFKVRKISKEQYKEMIDRAGSSESDEPPAQLPEDAGVPRGRTAQDKISDAIAGGM
jgi:hypothetical protein